MLFEKPIENETRICTDGLLFYFDKLPKYLLGVTREINFSLTYKENASVANVGVERFATYDSVQSSTNVSIDSMGEGFISKRFSFKVNWTMNYFWEWYLQGIKLTADGVNPQINIYPQNPDFATVSYVYSSTPAIMRIGNRNVLVLAATMNNSDEASIIFDGAGYTNFTIEMPDKTKDYVAKYDGHDCNDKNCNLVAQNEGVLNFTLNVSDREDLEVFSSEPKTI